jgi:hypothetical protein
VEGVEPKVEAEIRRCVADIAVRRYPQVEVGSWVPDVSGDWISVGWIEGEKALSLIPDLLEEGELGSLRAEVETIRAAKAGAVMVHSASSIAYAVGDERYALSESDLLTTCATWIEPDGRPAVMFWTGSRYRMVPLDELTGGDVDEYLLEDLEFYASGDGFEPYVVEDTPRSRVLVDLSLGG